MNSGNNTPKPPDPNVTAAAQTGSNQSTALYQSMLNMQDQRTPYGSLTYQSAGTWQYKDPTTGKMVTVPKFMANTVLSPAQQGLLNQQQQFDARYNQMALDQAAQIKDTLSKPFSYSPGEYEQWAGNLYDKLQAPSIARNKDDLEQSLANRGLNFGTAAYDQGMKDFYEGNQRARDSYMLDAYGTGLNTALTLRNQPLKEGIALMGAGQITEPTWVQGSQTGVSPTDVAGITSSAYSQQLARAQAQQQSSAGVWGALGQLGGAALGGWLKSDERSKKKAKKVRDDKESGLPVKRWAYLGQDMTHETPMAQDVEKKYPDAVAEIGGVKHVDWSQVPGGDKFAQDTLQDPAYHPLTSEPDGRMIRGRDMNPDMADPLNSIKGALPSAKYQDARFQKPRLGLQRLGQRSM